MFKAVEAASLIWEKALCGKVRIFVTERKATWQPKGFFAFPGQGKLTLETETLYQALENWSVFRTFYKWGIWFVHFYSFFLKFIIMQNFIFKIFESDWIIFCLWQ